MLKFEDYEVTLSIGKKTGYYCNAIGMIFYKEGGVLCSSQYLVV